MDSDLGAVKGHNHTPFGRPTPGRPIGRPGVDRPKSVIGVFSYYELVVLFLNVFPRSWNSPNHRRRLRRRRVSLDS
jgi:hypothetical protein